MKMLFRRSLLAAFVVVSASQPCVSSDRKETSFEKFFAPDHLVKVEITISDDDWDKLRHQTRDIAKSLRKTPPESPFTYFRGDVVVDGVRFPDVGIRKKGFVGSLDVERPSLKIKFNEYRKNGKLAGLDRLTLNNNKQDESIVSQFFAYQLFDKAGVNSPACNFAHVTLNGTSLGIYSNVESIKSPFLKRRFGDSSGNLYEGCLSDFIGDATERFQIKNNKKTSNRSDIRAVADVLASDQDDWRTQLDQVVDVDAFMRYWALETLMGFWDGYANNQNNFFIYNNPKDGRFQFIPWGADAALSRMGYRFIFQIGAKSVRAKAVLANRLYSDPKGREQYRQTMLDLLQSVWDEKEINSECERIKKLVTPYLHENQTDFDKALVETLRFVRHRRAEIMEEIKDGPAEWKLPALKPAYFQPVGIVKASFETTWLKDAPKDPFKHGTITWSKLNVNKSDLKVKRAGLFARQSRGQPTIIGRFETGNGANLELRLPIDKGRLDSDSTKPIPLMGQLSEKRSLFGGLFSNRKSIGTLTVAGTIRFDSIRFEKIEREPGEIVKGTINLEVLRLRHMFGAD